MEDGFAIVIAVHDKAVLALDWVIYRAKMDCVPEETRKPLQDGGTSFMRPLPGGARMYPETDVPYVTITDKMLKEAKKIAETYDQKLKRLAKQLKGLKTDRCS